MDKLLAHAPKAPTARRTSALDGSVANGDAVPHGTDGQSFMSNDVKQSITPASMVRPPLALLIDKQSRPESCSNACSTACITRHCADMLASSDHCSAIVCPCACVTCMINNPSGMYPCNALGRFCVS